jgi:hypothetical protein
MPAVTGFFLNPIRSVFLNFSREPIPSRHLRSVRGELHYFPYMALLSLEEEFFRCDPCAQGQRGSPVGMAVDDFCHELFPPLAMRYYLKKDSKNLTN